MITAFLLGLSMLFTAKVMLFLFLGVIAGLIVGLLPGISGLTMGAILLPIVWKFPPEVSLTLLMGAFAVTNTAGSITSILAAIPGEEANIPTILDGYQMNLKGEGTRAMSASFTCSVLSGILAVFVAFGTLTFMVPIGMAIKLPEYFFLIVLGLSFVVTLAGKSVGKGVISGAMGLLFSIVGLHAATGVHRFTFGSVYMMSGISLVTVGLGLFGLAEMFEMMMSGQETIAMNKTAGEFRQVIAGIKDVFHYKWTFFKSTLIGFTLGLCPGLGSVSSTFIAYGHAKQTSKNSDKFGTGFIEGVIAPESAHNANRPSVLLTTMIFGIPGSAFMALMMGAFLMAGITPGFQLVKNHMEIAFLLLIGIIISNIIGGLICMGFIKYLARLAFVPLDYMIPMIAILLFVAAYLADNRMPDVIMMIGFALLGVLMSKLDYPRAPFIMGFVLGPLFEYYLMGNLSLSGPLFFLTPISLCIMTFIAVMFTYKPMKPVFMRLLGKSGAQGKRTAR